MKMAKRNFKVFCALNKYCGRTALSRRSKKKDWFGRRSIMLLRNTEYVRRNCGKKQKIVVAGVP